jgi:tetratricopeptide (TPR) repeat protein
VNFLSFSFLFLFSFLTGRNTHSACYAGLKQWQKSLEDALSSVSKDPKFIKGYYRLSSAQTELQLFDDAEATLKAALALEPGNEVIVRQLKALNQKKNQKKAKKGPKQLDEAQVKEVRTKNILFLVLVSNFL